MKFSPRAILSKARAALASNIGSYTSQAGVYDAAKRGNRSSSPSVIKREDDHLGTRDRAAVNGSAMDLRRNASLVKWAVKKHLDYVSHFRFQVKTSDEAFNKSTEKLWTWWSQPENCDQTRRFNFRKLIRLAESTRTIGGDVLLVKNENGRLQLVESDRICNPTDIEWPPKGETWVQGLRLGKSGEVLEYAICDRSGNTERKLQAKVKSADAIFIAYRERHDQYRGISLIADAINAFRDLYEAQDYALAKIKLAQLFGVKIKRAGSDDPAAGLTGGGGEVRTDYDINLRDGPFMVDLEPGDDAEFMQSNNPSTESQAFMNHIIMMALKCLDLDYSFFDSSHTNFYGSRAALNSYLKSCESKQEDLIEAQDRVAQWIIGYWVEAGILTLPAGMTLEDVAWEFIPDGVPFWDAQKDAGGSAMLISMGLATFEGIARQTGSDFRENIDSNALAIQYAKDKGVPITLPNIQGVSLTSPGANPATGAPDMQAMIDALMSDPQAMQQIADAIKSGN